MGEIAEMMLDGTLCAGCGVYMGDPCEYPRYCAGCKPDHVSDDFERPQPSPTKVSCPQCKRRVKQAGLKDHMRDAHGAKS